MSYTMTRSETTVIDGVTALQQTVITDDNKAGSSPASVPAAKSGALTVRTNNTDGSLTLAGGHGVTTGNLIDLFWTGGSRRAVVVGTVATNVVPISGGSGDNLPAAATAITVMKSLNNQENFVVDGDTVTAIMIKSDVPSTVRFLEADGTTIVATIPLEADNSTTAKYVYTYDSSKGPSPLAGGTDIAKIGFVHGSTSAQTAFNAIVLHS